MFTEKRHVKTEYWQGINERKIRSIRQTEEVLVNGLDFISKLVDTRHCMLSRLLVSRRIIRDKQTTNMFRDGRWHKFMAIEHETKTIKVELTKKLSNRFLQSVRQRYNMKAKAYFPSLIDRQSLTRKNPLRIELI
jgi:hypothetical protein